MATRSIRDTVKVQRILTAQTITTSALAAEHVDTLGYDSVLLAVDIGNIDGLGGGSPVDAGGSPTGGTIQVQVEHADDDGDGNPSTYANVADTDLDGATQSSGVVNTFSESNTDIFVFGYIGSRRFLRITFTPSGLGSGGPVMAYMINGHAHISPVTQGS